MSSYYLEKLKEQLTKEIPEDLKKYYKSNKEYLQKEWKIEDTKQFAKLFKSWQEDSLDSDFDCEKATVKYNAMREIEYLESRDKKLTEIENTIKFFKEQIQPNNGEEK